MPLSPVFAALKLSSLWHPGAPADASHGRDPADAPSGAQQQLPRLQQPWADCEDALLADYPPCDL